MDFLSAVNRVLRLAGIIAGYDDNLTSFSDTQHEAMSNLAQISIQDELNDLVADKVLPYEQATAFITIVTGTRIYSLANDFIRMQDEK